MPITRRTALRTATGLAAARKYNRVVQVGTQQRSGKHYQKAKELLESGYIGQIVSTRGGSYRNIMPGFGAPPEDPAPNDFDYDMWLGPASKRLYNKKRSIYPGRGSLLDRGNLSGDG